MQVSTRRGISYPVAGRTDAPDIPLHFANLINAIDLDTPLYTGTEAAKPAANTRVQGSWYWATDSSLLYFNTGATWLGLSSTANTNLTGNPTTTTQAVTDNSTRIATTAFVRSIVPPGVINPYAAASSPAGWLLCDGSAVSRTTYAALFAVLGTTFGAGDGSTTFNLPNLQGRAPIGKNAGTFATLGATGGEETHVSTIAEMPAHDHGAVTGATSAGTPAGTLSNDSAGTPAGTITATSAGTPAGTLSADSAGTPAGTVSSVSAGTPAGTITAVSAGTPAGTISSVSAGTPSGSVHSNFSGSGGALNESHISTTSTGMLAGDANAGDALLLNTFTGTAMAGHSHAFTGTAMGTHTHTFTGTVLAAHNHTFAGTAMGTHTHTFTGTAMATHTHTFTGDALAAHTHTFTGTAMGTHTHAITAQGGGGAHNNLAPYIVLNYIIKT